MADVPECQTSVRRKCMDCPALTLVCELVCNGGYCDTCANKRETLCVVTCCRVQPSTRLPRS